MKAGMKSFHVDCFNSGKSLRVSMCDDMNNIFFRESRKDLLISIVSFSMGKMQGRIGKFCQYFYDRSSCIVYLLIYVDILVCSS